MNHLATDLTLAHQAMRREEAAAYRPVLRFPTPTSRPPSVRRTRPSASFGTARPRPSHPPDHPPTDPPGALMNTAVLNRPDAVADPVKAKHEAVWASGDYAAVAREVIPALGPVLVDACQVSARRPRARCRGRKRQRRHPGRPAGRRRRRQRPDPGPARAGAGRRRAARRRPRLGAGRRRGAAVRRRIVRRRDVLRRRDVRAAPPGRRRRAGPSAPARRPARAGQLDARRVHRPDVRHDEAVRPASPAGGPAAAAVGRRPPTCSRSSATGSPTSTARRRRLRVDRFGSRRGVPSSSSRPCYGPTIAAFKSLADDPDRAAELHAGAGRAGRRRDLEGGVMEWEYLARHRHPHLTPPPPPPPPSRRILCRISRRVVASSARTRRLGMRGLALPNRTIHHHRSRMCPRN